MPLRMLRETLRRVDCKAHFKAVLEAKTSEEIDQLLTIGCEMLEDRIIENFEKSLRDCLDAYNEKIRKENGPYAGETIRIVKGFMDWVFRQVA